jgi:catechol 2,3-dioxygenase-like lactoylglutathione lyase family enzyme
MQVIDKLTMIMVATNDMPKAKEFYSEKLGLKVVTDYRQDDDNWWVSLVLPGSQMTITLSTLHGHLKPGTMQVYFATSDIEAAHNDLSNKGVKVKEIKDDLHGPGSGVKWFTLEDTDGNVLYLEQA